MSDFPAIAMFEFDSVPRGAVAADAMAKAAPLDHFQVGTVQPGRYLILLGGQVAALEEATTAGNRTAEADDWILLPDIDAGVLAAVRGKRSKKFTDTLAVAECDRMPTLVAATDATIKQSSVQVLELRLGDGLGGKGLLHLGGLLADIEHAVDVLAERVGDPQLLRAEIISNASSELGGAFGQGTRFGGK